MALPPLGLTQVSTSSTLRPNLEVIDGTAYLGVTEGVWTVDTSGSQTFIPISHPTLGTPSSVTRAVKALDGELYVAANFNSFTNQAAAALFPLDQPTLPIVTWETPRIRVSGVDVNLRTFGGFDYDDGDEASKFLLDGSIEALPYPPGSNSSNNITRLNSMTPRGYALGSAGIPGTIGSAPSLWSPTGEFSFLDGSNSPTSIRDREDGTGVNTAWDIPAIKYGGDAPILIAGNPENFAAIWVMVSHSDFVVVQDSVFPQETKYAFYPGINPDHPDRAVPLLDVFPQLTTIDIDYISDLASVSGYLYMTLSGSDGTFLFGARDPSVVPEPATAAMMLLATIFAVTRRGGRSDDC